MVRSRNLFKNKAKYDRSCSYYPPLRARPAHRRLEMVPASAEFAGSHTAVYTESLEPSQVGQDFLPALPIERGRTKTPQGLFFLRRLMQGTYRKWPVHPSSGEGLALACMSHKRSPAACEMDLPASLRLASRPIRRASGTNFVRQAG